ncbi:MAG: diguanylate cyclase [Burkholderiaceae bacterium]|nr:MAG: diguanylate cyclase [Burkholderiaceae bacterium]
MIGLRAGCTSQIVTLMVRLPFVQPLLVFLLGLAVTLGVDLYGQHRAESDLYRQGGVQLARVSQNLQAELADVLQLSKELAARAATHAELDDAQWQRMAAETLLQHRHVRNVALSQGTVVRWVYPLRGNEAVLGLDYRQRSDQWADVSRAIDTRQTVLSGPVRLVQGGGLGLITRVPIFESAQQGQPGAFVGLLSVVIRLDGLLVDAGLDTERLPFTFAVARDTGSGGVGDVFVGDARLFSHSKLSAQVALPQGRWHVAAQLKPQAHEQAWRPWPVRLGGLVLSMVLALLAMFIGRVMPTDHSPSDPLPGTRRSVGLQTIIVGVLLVMVLPVLVVQGWFAYQSASRTAERFQEELASEVGERVYDKVVQFFEVPRRVLAFSADQFRSGAVEPADADAVSRNFLLQIRQQPLLTFLSLGTAQGEYLSASRPPVGRDQGLRLLEARVASDRVVHVYRADDVRVRGELLSLGNRHFDTRTRPWFQAAVKANGPSWYGAYRYTIDDQAGNYTAVGLGMSAPVLDRTHRFAGVVTADVALSQLNLLLSGITKEFGGVAFLAEQNGQLLAASTPEPVYRLPAQGVERIAAQDSQNPLIRAAGEAIRDKGQARGRTYREVQGERHLIDWWTYQLPDGPGLIIGVVMPQSRFAAPSEGLLGNVLMVALVLMVGGMLAAWLLSERLARPLVSLSQWAVRLGQGDWSHPHSSGSGIAEVQTLSHAMNVMAAQLRDHTEELTRQVAERTAELEQANQVLSKRSHTDGLTGVANRRRFDELLSQEWSRAMRAGQALALIMLDVDHFKLFNDRYGHLAGDDCLRSIARVLTEQCRRAGDQPARYGGEEFVILVAEDDVDGALQLAERVRLAIEALGIPHVDSAHHVVTVSLGVAVTEPVLGESAQKLISRADAALYRAKHGGRNQTHLAEPDTVF